LTTAAVGASAVFAIFDEVTMAFPYKKILCPIDFDENSSHALESAIEIARHFNAAIFLIHAVPLVAQFGEVPLPVSLYQDQQRAALARLNEIAGQKLSGIEHRTAVYAGDVAGSILQAVEQFKPDLLVLATHGRTGLAHLVLGSVAEAVVRRSACPVLTIRAEKPRAQANPE
jgi:nucleotide-binding universal stress UspA family protein